MNKKITKLLSVFVVAGVVGTSVAGLVGCKKGGHSHSATGWENDENQHWQVCTEDNEEFNRGNHVDANEDGKCDTCLLEIGSSSQPTVTGVTVTATGSVTSVNTGATLQLSAVVAGTNNPSQQVTWSIKSGATATEATVSSSGLLTAGSVAGTVTVVATSTADNTKSGELVITVNAAQAGADNAIVVPFESAAAGPVDGEQQLTIGFKGSDFDTGANTSWTDGTFTVTGGEVRNRNDNTGTYTRSVKNAVITVEAPAGAKLEYYFASGSSTIGNAAYTITRPDGSSEKVTINKASKVLDSLIIESTEAGTYKFEKGAGTVDVFECKISYVAKSAPIKEIQITDTGITDYLVTQKVDCTKLQVSAIDGNGVPHKVDLKNCKIDASNYNPAVSGEYNIGVTYCLTDNLSSDETEFTATYPVKVYMVDSIRLSTIGLSSNKQVTVQQAYLPNGTFSADNLSVMATCKLGNATIEQKLKSDWYSVSTPTLTAEGKQTVNVSVNTDYTVDGKAVSAEYDVLVKNKKDVVENKVEVTVGQTGEFATLTQAVQYLKACAYESGVHKVIKVEAGTYTEKVWLDVDNVTLVGQGATMDDTVLTYSLVEGDADDYSGSLWALNCATLHVTGANFKAYNISIRNDFNYIANSGNYSGSQAAQGVALTLDADGAVLYKTHLYGNQDTLYMKSGRSYYYQSQIDGNVDFIFGNDTGLAFFEDCDIVAISRSATDKGTNQNGYVTAAKHSANTKPDYGYIFYGCHLKDDGKVADGAMALGRPWGESATVAYINCDFTKAYATSGYGTNKTDRWCAMSSSSPVNADFCEYGSTGEGAITTAVTGGKVLTEAEAANYTKANIFAATNGKQTSAKFDCDTEYAKLRILVGLDQGEMPQDKTITVNLKDDTLPNGNCVEAINTKYAGKITWAGSGSFEVAKPQNGVKVGLDTVITVDVVGEVTLAPGYQLPASDYIISYKDGKATIKFVAISGTYGDYIGSIVVDTSITPEDTQSVVVTLDYNDGVTANKEVDAVAGQAFGKPADPVREGYKFVGWQLNGAAYDFATPVNEAITLVAQWETQSDYDLTAGGTVNLYEFTTGQVSGGTATYRGITVDATTGKFAPRSNDVQVNAGVKLKFKVNASTTAEAIKVTFTAAAGDQYIPTHTVEVVTEGTDTYAVVTITSNSYPSTMTVAIAQ